MRDILGAIVAGLLTPVRHARLALVLWLGRLLPIVLFFTLPLYGAAQEDLGKNPQARALIDAPSDASGFSWSWTNDFVARFDPAERVFWLCLGIWFLVALLEGGFVASLVLVPKGPLLAACGRFAGRFLRLALLAAVVVYLADAAINGVLAESHARAVREEFVQDYATKHTVWRGILFVAIVVIVGAVQSYAQIDVVANERRSAFLSLARGFGILFVRLPKLLLVEAAMLVAAGAAFLLARLLSAIAAPGADATWLSFGLFLAAMALGSYLRTAIELGALAARCRVLVPPAPPLSPLETVLGRP